MENRYKNKLKLSITFILSIFLGLGMVACSNNKDTSEENITSETSSSEEKGTSEIISGDDSSEEVLSATNNSENTSIEEENSSIEESGVSTEITSEENLSNEEVSSENFSSDVVSSEENLSEISSDESSEIISSEDVSSEEINEEDSTPSSGNDESSSELPPEIELFEAIYLEETNSYMLTKYNGTEEEIIIPSTFNELEVTHLGDYLFYECRNISKMYIPNTIKYFGEEIFNWCYIETLEFDGTLADWVSIEFGHTISPAVFAKEFYLLNENNEKENYANKKYIEIPEGVTRISSNFLIDFKNAYSITLPSSLDEVYISYDFYMMTFCVCFDFAPTYEIVNKSNLNLDFLEKYFTNITYSNESKLLIENDFVFIEKEEGYFLLDYVGKNLTITLPDSCNDSSYKLHEYSFIANNNIVEVTIPSSIDEISTYFFVYSSSLLKLTIENENINSLRLLLFSPYLEILLPNFDNPNFKNIYIEGPYLNNYSVSKIEDDTNNIIYEEEFVFYKFNNKYILLNYFGDSPNIVLPDDIDGHPYDIYIDAFFINSRNINIEIPLNVRNISVGGYVNILPNYHILSFYFNGEPTDFIQTSINFPLYDSQNINFYCKNESGEYVSVFDYQIDLGTVKEIHLENSIDTIGNLINLYSSLEKIYFHGTLEEWFEINIESIGEYEIIIIDGDQRISLKDIKEIYIKDDKGSIEENDLYYYPSLETIYFEGTIEDWLKMDLDTDLFNSNINIYFKDGEDYIEIKDVVISESIISLENKNLSLIKTIESVTIGTSLKAITGNVFEDFDDDLKIYLDMTVEEYVINKLYYNIDREVYLKDENSNWISSNSITEIIIPDKVTEINCWLSLFHNLVNVSITEGVTSIGSSAFQGCSSLTNIIIPNSVTSIGNYAFCNCDSLTDVIIPNSVTSIGSSAFSNCDSLTNIIIPNSVTSIGSSAFEGCSSLTNIIIPNSVTSIGNYAFYNCKSLTSVIIPNSVTSIGNGAFSGCSSLTIYCEVETQPSGWDSNWNLYRPVYWGINETNFIEKDGIQYVIEDNIAKVTRYVGSNTEVEIPSTIELNENSYEVTIIGNYAFYNCKSLTSVIIPNSVTSIGNGAFSGCNSLESITIPFVGQYADGSGETLFGYIFGASSYYYDDYVPTSLKEVIITGGTSIWYSAFEGCSFLTNIIIPNSVTSIGHGAFSGCNSLESITIPFVGQYADGSGETFFGYIFGAGSYHGNDDYVPTSLKEVIITGGTSIGDSSFYNCSSLTSIVIPDSVTSIGNYAFSRCSSLENVYYNGTIEDWCNIAFINYNSNPMCYATNLYFLDENGDVEYNGNKYSLLPNEVVIPNSVTEIKPYTFCNCNSLTNIIIPNSVTSIGFFAFVDCNSLTNIIIPNSVTSIGSCAFGGCSSLTNIIIPNTVTSIGDWAFTNCDSLTDVIIPNSVTSIGSYAFSDCKSLTSVIIPNSVTSIGNSAFSGCNSLTIYCEVESQLGGWDSTWNLYRPVYWANEWEYVDGIPTPIE